MVDISDSLVAMVSCRFTEIGGNCALGNREVFARRNIPTVAGRRTETRRRGIKKREAEELLELGLWRPINTAPKDGRTILIWYAGEPIHAAYLAEHHGRIPQWYLLDKWRNWGPVSQPPQYWTPLPQLDKVDERIKALVQMLQQAASVIESCSLSRREAWLSEWNKPEPAKGEEPKP